MKTGEEGGWEGGREGIGSEGRGRTEGRGRKVSLE